jgi:hypothetical protein
MMKTARDRDAPATGEGVKKSSVILSEAKKLHLSL